MSVLINTWVKKNNSLSVLALLLTIQRGHFPLLNKIFMSTYEQCA